MKCLINPLLPDFTYYEDAGNGDLSGIPLMSHNTDLINTLTATS